MKRGGSIPPSVQTWLLLKLPGNRKCRPNLTAIAQNTAENSKVRAGLKGESTGVHRYVHVYIRIFPIKNLIVRTQAQAQVYTEDPRNASGGW